MRHFSHSAELPWPAARILEQITAADYLHFRYHDSGLIHCEIETLRDDDEAFEARIVRQADTAKLPGVARKLLGHAVEFVQRHRWQRSGPPFHGELEISVTGMPGAIHSELRLLPDGDDATCFAVEGRIEAKLPLVGGQIERMLAGRAEDNFLDGVAAMRSWLSEHA